jgi:hypothetical protein
VKRRQKIQTSKSKFQRKFKIQAPAVLEAGQGEVRRFVAEWMGQIEDEDEDENDGSRGLVATFDAGFILTRGR